MAKLRERLAMNKQSSYRFNTGRFNLKKLNKVDGKEQYCIEISSFTALEKSDAEADINRTWETIRENVKIFNQRGSRLL
jgi:hypothetical protein